MRIIYKEFYEYSRGDIDAQKEKSIECNSYKEIAETILQLLNAKDGQEIKITKIELEDNIDLKKDIYKDDDLGKIIHSIAEEKNKAIKKQEIN